MNILHFETNKKLLLLLPPIAIIAWHIFYMASSSAFYNSRVDPDYAYLLNGLNCALGEFQRIGHVDHPGTPFQMLTGLFIIILHFFIGTGEITSDVISNPEIYLTGCLTLLILLEAFVSYWVAKKIYEITNDLKISLFLGFSILFYGSVLDYSNRYIPDHLLVLIVLLMAVPIFKYLYIPTYSSLKFVIFTGILAGIGVICKVNFLPLVIVPFILVDRIKYKMLYAVVFFITAFLNFLPILSKHAAVRNFLMGISKHDGLYGSGNAQFLNLKIFIDNLKVFSIENLWFVLVFAGVSVLLLFSVIKKRKLFFHNRIDLFYLSFLLASLFGMVITLKHYKNYYFAPILALTIITISVIWYSMSKTFRYKKTINILFVVSILVYSYFLYPKLINQISNLKTNINQRNYTDAQLNKYIKPESYKIIELSWGLNLTVDYGIGFGLCYVASRNEFYNDYEIEYSNALTWIGGEKPFSFLNMASVFNNEVFYSGKNIYVFDSPSGFKTDEINSFLISESIKRNIKFSIDTIFYAPQSQVYIIEYKNLSSWHCKDYKKVGFEGKQSQVLVFDDGITELQNNGYKLVAFEKCTGQQSILLNKEFPISPSIPVESCKENDYVLVSVKIKGELPSDLSNIIEWNSRALSDMKWNISESSIDVIGNKWNLIQIGFLCQESFDLKSYLSIINETNSNWFLDDLKVQHFTCE